MDSKWPNNSKWRNVRAKTGNPVYGVMSCCRWLNSIQISQGREKSELLLNMGTSGYGMVFRGGGCFQLYPPPSPPTNLHHTNMCKCIFLMKLKFNFIGKNIALNAN